MIPRPRKLRAFAPDPNAPGALCAAPGCTEPGEYRAPKSRTNLREFHWFCLEHVREYNASWDYYKGMSPGEIETALRSDTHWQRPTGPLGRLGATARSEQVLEEAFHFTFAENAVPVAPKPPVELREALEVLGLAWPVTLEVVKAKYKKLAKRHHPDANGGDKASEEILKTVNLAYATLRRKLADHLVHSPQPAAQ